MPPDSTLGGAGCYGQGSTFGGCVALQRVGV